MFRKGRIFADNLASPVSGIRMQFYAKRVCRGVGGLEFGEGDCEYCNDGGYAGVIRRCDSGPMRHRLNARTNGSSSGYRAALDRVVAIASVEMQPQQGCENKRKHSMLHVEKLLK